MAYFTYYFYIWRVQDSVKNSITMAASAMFSPKELMGKNSEERKDMMISKGTNWNDYPRYYKEGAFVKRVQILVDIPEEVMANIPQKNIDECENLQQGKAVRSRIVFFEDMPKFKDITNKVAWIFDNEEMELKDS